MSFDAWNSYISDSKPITTTVKRGVLGGKLSDAKVSQELPKEDTTWHTVNAASAKLIKRTGQPEIAAKLEADNQLDANRRAESKVGRPAKSKKSLLSAAPEAPRKEGDAPPPTPAPPGPGLAPPIAAPSQAPAGPGMAVEVELEAPSLPILTLEQHMRRDNQTALFAMSIDRPHRPTAQMILNTPPASEALNYCEPYIRGDMSWYDNHLKLNASNPRLTYQSVPLMSREILQTFLRAPDPKMVWERPCYNLDRDPYPHEGRVRCIAHRLSEKQTGKGYRLRELLLNDQSVKVNASLARGLDPSIHMLPVPEMCYMCHVYMTSHACFNAKNKQSDQPYIMNRFCVDIDKPGEYDRRKMLCVDDVNINLWGCFPMWNERHYVACRVNSEGRQFDGFAETDDLLFRLPRVPLQVKDASYASSSIQFTLSSVEPAGSNFQQ